MIKINKIEIQNTRFPNGELKINEDKVHEAVQSVSAGNTRVEFFYRGDDSIIELYMMVKYIKDIYNTYMTLHFEYLPFSRMDRQGVNGAFTLKYLTDWINTWGVELIIVDEPHSDVSTALLGAMAKPVTEYLFGTVKEEIGFNEEEDIVFFPDAGAQKRYHGMKVPHLVGFKHRDWNTGEIKSLEICGTSPYKPFRAVIVDDLCSFGGTFLHSAKRLKQFGATEIYLVVAHCENSVLHGELINSGLINKIYTTDSIFTEEHPLIKVVSGV